ncbi:MAG: ECF-type sigma factor [Bryobacteraceae bacterium]
MATEARQEQITRLLNRWGSGSKEDLDRLLPLVYGELRRIAASQLRRESAATVQPTELVHELYIKIRQQSGQAWESREHFYAVCARVLRYLLTDHARKRLRARRGGGQERIPIDNADLPLRKDADVVALDDALSTLELVDERKARIVELRFFGGFELPEIGEMLAISPTTIKREWATAKAWLYQEIRR